MGLATSTWTRTTGFNSGYPHFVYETQATTQDFPFNSPTVLKPGPDNASDQVPPSVYTNQQIGNYRRRGTIPGRRSFSSRSAIRSGHRDQRARRRSLRHPPVPGQPQFTPPPLPLRPVVGDGGERFSSVPPPNENRFIPNEVVVQVASTAPADIDRSASPASSASVITSQNADDDRPHRATASASRAAAPCAT